jgi:hypothetical protein
MRRHPLRTFGIGAFALATVLVLPACGGTSDESKVREAVSEYLDSVGEKDYSAACDFLHQDAKAKLGGTGECANALEKRYDGLSGDVRQDLDDIDVDDVAINGTSATVATGEVRVEVKTKTKRKGKTKTSTSYHPAPDVTGGAGFALKKSGDNWQIASGY